MFGADAGVWRGQAAQEVSTDGKRTGNLPTMVVLQAFVALLWSNLSPDDMAPAVVSNLLGALVSLPLLSSFSLSFLLTLAVPTGLCARAPLLRVSFSTDQDRHARCEARH